MEQKKTRIHAHKEQLPTVRHCRWISACGAPSSKPAARNARQGCGRPTGQTDGGTDGQQTVT